MKVHQDPAHALTAAEPPDKQATSLVERAHRHIKQAILTGEYKPGTLLRSQRVANEAGVSIIPVREALRLLEKEELVVSIPNRGVLVASVSLEDAKDAYRTRLVIESDALRRSHHLLTRDDIAEARELTAQLRDLCNVDEDQAARVHREFHAIMYRHCGSEWELRFIDVLWTHTERYRRIGRPRRGTPESRAGEHSQLLDVIENGDVEQAVEALRQHQERTVAILEESPIFNS